MQLYTFRQVSGCSGILWGPATWGPRMKLCSDELSHLLGFDPKEIEFQNSGSKVPGSRKLILSENLNYCYVQFGKKKRRIKMHENTWRELNRHAVNGVCYYKITRTVK